MTDPRIRTIRFWLLSVVAIVLAITCREAAMYLIPFALFMPPLFGGGNSCCCTEETLPEEIEATLVGDATYNLTMTNNHPGSGSSFTDSAATIPGNGGTTGITTVSLACTETDTLISGHDDLEQTGSGLPPVNGACQWILTFEGESIFGGTLRYATVRHDITRCDPFDITITFIDVDGILEGIPNQSYTFSIV